MSYSGNRFVFQASFLKDIVGMNTFSLTLFCQFSSTMKYEIQETCPGHIAVIVVDDRTCNAWSWRWAPSSSDYLIYHLNHLCLLPKMMTKLIILTSESYHHLALAYLTLTSDAFLMCAWSSSHWVSQLSLRTTIYVCLWHIAQARQFYEPNIFWLAIESI